MLNVGLFNVMLLGLSFHFSSVGYITCFNSQKYVIDALRDEDPTYKANSYIGFCIVYGSFALSSIGASTFIKLVTPRGALMIGTLFNMFYIAQFLYPITWIFYFGNFLAGVSGGIIWTAQGNFLTRNSTSENIGRNSGILWALIQSGNITGNVYMIVTINNNDFNATDRKWLFGFLTSMLIMAFLTTLLFRKSIYNLEGSLSLKKRFVKGFKLSKTRDMLLLSVSFFYNGIELSFYSGVYSSAIGHNGGFESLRETTRVSISGILIGCGEAVAGMIFGILGKKTVIWGRYPIILTGCVIHIISYILICINFPNSITKGRTTNEYSIIKSNLPLAFICSFALGFADACYVTQIYGILGSVFASEGATTFAIYRLIQCFGSVVAFAYAPIGLYAILCILIVTNIISAVCFSIAELRPTYVPHVDDMKMESREKPKKTVNT